VAGVEETPPSSGLSTADDSYDNGKASSVLDTVFKSALLLLCFVFPVALFFLYSPTAPSAEMVLRGPQASLRGMPGAAQEMASTSVQAMASTSAPIQRRHPLQQDSGLPAGPEKAAPSPQANGTTSTVRCDTTEGPITIAVHQAWAPRGAARFLDMVQSGFFSTKVALFRAVRGFICQTGIPGDPAVTKLWKQKGRIQDDPQWLDESDRRRMKRGYLSFAGGGGDSRGTEFFFSFRDVGLGTSPWEVPFGTLVGEESFRTMDHWYVGYGDMAAFGGKAPSQGSMYTEGLRYLEKGYPKIDYITSCSIVAEGLSTDQHVGGREPIATSIPGYKTTYERLKEGSGTRVQKGNRVTVHATGVLQQTGKKFWSTKDPGQQPFSYEAGVGQVITGWDQGLLGMQTGEERKIIIPADEGYGADGFSAWGIPPGATLEFTLEVLSIT